MSAGPGTRHGGEDIGHDRLAPQNTACGFANARRSPGDGCALRLAGGASGALSVTPHSLSVSEEIFMSDASASGFGKFVPGFEFLQNLAGQAASGMAQGLGNSLPQMPNLGHWVAPTFNVEELDKRIEELKAVHFWLDQNAKALGATIQALEVQKMTLATLKNMNFSLGDVANALKIKAADTVSGLTGGKSQFAGLEIPPRNYGQAGAAPAPEAAAPEESPAAKESPRRSAAKAAAGPAAPASGVIDPVQWWGALSQQFQTIAANAMKDMAQQGALDATRHVATGLTEQAVKTATGMAGKAADTVARNVGTAVGMGQAAARAVTSGHRAAAPATPKATPKSTRKAAPPPAPTRQKAAPKKVAAPKKAATRAARAPSAQPSAGAGDWPTAFFPGFQVPGAPAAAPAPAARQSAAKKPAPRSARRR